MRECVKPLQLIVTDRSECVRNCQRVWIEAIDQCSELASTHVTCLSNEDGGMDFCARAGGRRAHLGLLLQSPHKAEDLGHFRVPDVEAFA